MSSYIIDFSEPLRVGFEIAAGGYNGPGGGTASTSLRLHGRGTLEWGEGVNEDLVRLTENFASASPPQFPVTGQSWVELKLYRKGPTKWFRYNLATNVWEEITGVGTTTGKPAPAGATEGQYKYDSATGILWGFYEVSTVGTSTFDWRERSLTTQTTDTLPDSSTKPEQSVKVHNAFGTTATDKWVPPQSVTVAPTSTPPSNPTAGMLWFDTTSDILKIYDPTYVGGTPTGWRGISTGGTAATGDLDMGTNRIINVGNATGPLDALNRQTGDSRYVNLSGDTMTGALNLGTFKITNLGTPTATTDAATKQYVDTAVAGATSGDISAVFNNPVGSFAYGAGDIAIAGGKIYIALTAGTSAVPGGGWKQVWPATYS